MTISVDDLQECNRISVVVKALHEKFCGYLKATAGKKGGKGKKLPSLGWTASNVLERLVTYPGGITEPVLLTELQQLWLKPKATNADSFGGSGARPGLKPIEEGLKKHCSADATLFGYVVASDGEKSECGVPQYVELTGSCSEQAAAPQGKGERGGPVKVLLPFAMRRKLCSGPSPLSKERCVEIKGWKAIAAKSDVFLSPTESLVFILETGNDRDVAFLRHRFGVNLTREGEDLSFSQDSAVGELKKMGSVLCGKVLESDLGASKEGPVYSIRLEILLAEGMGSAFREMQIVLHPCQRGIATMFREGDYIITDISTANSSALSELEEGTCGRLKCPRGVMFYKIRSSDVVGSKGDHVERGRDFRNIASISDKCQNITVVGLIVEVSLLQKTSQSSSNKVSYKVVLRDLSGSISITMAFKQIWDVGLLEEGHMVALTGLSAVPRATDSSIDCMWEESPEASVYNLSSMHSRLFSSFLSSEDKKVSKELCTSSSNRIQLLGFRNVHVNTLHKRCLRKVQNVVFNISCEMDDDNDIACCTATNVTQTPETPATAQGLYECSFCSSDCSSDDVTLGYSGHVKFQVGEKVMTASADSSALKEIIRMEPLDFKRCSRSQRKAHLDTLIGKWFTISVYKALQSIARKKILEDSTKLNTEEDKLSISLAVVK